MSEQIEQYKDQIRKYENVMLYLLRRMSAEPNDYHLDDEVIDTINTFYKHNEQEHTTWFCKNCKKCHFGIDCDLKGGYNMCLDKNNKEDDIFPNPNDLFLCRECFKKYMKENNIECNCRIKNDDDRQFYHNECQCFCKKCVKYNKSFYKN